MNTTEAIASVQTSTQRPDKDAEALEMINEAISVCTLRTDFSFDLVEDTLAIDATEYAQVVDISSLTRFRKFEYLRPTSRVRFLVPTDAQRLYSPAGSVQKDRYVIAGTNLTVVLSQLDSSLEIGYFRYAPILTESSGNNTHWMLDRMPFTIVNYAKARIFESIGDDASAKRFMDKYEEQFLIASRDFKYAFNVKAQ